MSWTARWLIAGLVLWLCAATAPAQDVTSTAPVVAITSRGVEPSTSGQRPALAGRVVKVFDFEDGLTTGDPIPPFWVRAQDDPDVPRKRPGFSRWNRAEYEFENAKSGQVSVRLPTRGGSTSLLLEPGVLPVFQSADYMVSADIRTRNATHSRAVVAARFLDAHGTPIEGSETRSEPIASEHEWRNVTLSLIGGVENAAFIQIELLVLQPQQLGVSTTGHAKEWAQDIDASASFDNVSVVQLPRVELRTTSAINVIEQPTRPALSLLVRDLTGEPLRAVVQVLDHTGSVIDEREMQVAAGRSRTDWTPKLTRLGWYRATLEVFNERTRIGATAVDFAWVDGAASSESETESKSGIAKKDTRNTEAAVLGGAAGRARYGVVATELPEALARSLPSMTKMLGVGWASVPVWSPTISKENAGARAKTLAPVVSALAAQWCDVSFSLARVPTTPGPTQRLDADDAMALLRMDESYWRPMLDPFVDRFGQQVRRWDIGLVGDERLAWQPSLATDLARLDSAINKLVPVPIIGVPTGAAQMPVAVSAANGLSVGFHVGVPRDASPQTAAAIARHWGNAPGSASRASEVTVSLLADADDSLGYGEAADRTVKNLVSILAAGAESAGANDIRAGLVDPWRVESDPHATPMPKPEFAAWRNAIRHLADRRVVGAARTPTGVVAYILAPVAGAPEGRGGALVAWNEAALPEDAMIEVWPTDGGASIVDVFGNVTPLAKMATVLEGDARRRVPNRLAVGSSPVFIEGVDDRLTRFLSSIRLSPSLISTASTDDEHAIVMSNPWAQPINGQISILEPGGFTTAGGVRDRAWKISPRVQRFLAAANATQRLPVQIGFSAAEEAGPINFVLDVALTSERTGERMLVTIPAELGLSSARLEVAAHVRGVGDDADVVIEVHVANLSAASANLELTAFAPDLPRMKSNISELEAGNQATRRFVIPRAAGLLSGKRVTVSLSDPEAGIRIARSAQVP